MVLGALNRGNQAQTVENAADARFRTRFYKTNLANAHQEVLRAIPQLRTYGQSWHVVSDEENEVLVEVPVLVFTDDLVVTLKEAKGGVKVDVQSAARLGKSDFGENRRHVLQLLAVLDALLPA